MFVHRSSVMETAEVPTHVHRTVEEAKICEARFTELHEGNGAFRCAACGGCGEVKHTREWETGQWSGETCNWCNGDGHGTYLVADLFHYEDEVA